jgi:hypothetical protein
MLVATQFACTSTGLTPGDPQDLLAAELVAEQPSRQTRRGWKDEVKPDNQVFERMRAVVEQDGGDLLAFAFLSTGVHPYSVTSFTAYGEKVTVVVTAMYWGMVKGKWVAQISRETFDKYLSATSGILECSDTPEYGDHFFGAALVHGEPPAPTTYCEASWGSELAARFGEELSLLLEDRMSRTYEPR